MAQPSCVPAATQGGDCVAGCPHCALGSAAEVPSTDVLRGWSLASAAALYFLVPLSMACVGAALDRGPVGQSIGAAAGLGAGMALTSWRAARRRATREAGWQQL